MKTKVVLFFALFVINVATTSCEPDEIVQTPSEQRDVLNVDPPSGEAEEEVEPNNN